MSRISFENYGARARQALTYTEMAGRHGFQEADEKNIPADVTAKLNLDPGDVLLDIGCGTGNVLLPLSRLVKSATGIDHPAALRMLCERITDEPVQTIEGNFLDLAVRGPFTKILAYSVLHYLRDFQEAITFIERALSLLAPGGAFLVGDIPNADKRRRFINSERGKAFQAQWESRAGEARKKAGVDLPPDPELVEFTDENIGLLLATYRSRGFETYLLPQPENLPMCFSREDILIRRLAP